MGIAEWMREVRRLCAALSKGYHGSVPAPVSLAHVNCEQLGKAPRLVWRASCGVASADTESPQTAMQAVIVKLNRELDVRIEEQREELAKLQEAQRRGLTALEGAKR